VQHKRHGFVVLKNLCLFKFFVRDPLNSAQRSEGKTKSLQMGNEQKTNAGDCEDDAATATAAAG